MIITIDGYDGTGKTTLAKKISAVRNFVYVEKPFILKYQFENNCSYEQARIETEKIEQKLFAEQISENIINYYCEALLWLKQFKDVTNIVLDRGVLTLYAVCGTRENEQCFIPYLNKGIAFDGSIYLTADDNIRRMRIIANDPEDPDLRYPVKWRENNLEEFASEQKINHYKIQTDQLNLEEVEQTALKFLDSTILFNDNIMKRTRKPK